MGGLDLDVHSFFIVSSASRISSGLLARFRFALLTSNDESLGLLAIHFICSDVMGFMFFLSRLKVSAMCSANSYLLSRVAPAK
jgi:hypothetical protein